jgi:hypothetical protein
VFDVPDRWRDDLVGTAERISDKEAALELVACCGQMSVYSIY